MNECYVKKIKVNNIPLLCFSDGRIYRLPYKTKGNQKRKGTWASASINSSKYHVVKVSGKTMQVHRILAMAFLDTYGETLEVDHIDGNRLNNHISNLRMVTHSQNCRGARIPKTKQASHHRGVTWNKRLNKWLAQIACQEKGMRHLGVYTCEHAAAKAYNEAATENGYMPEALNQLTKISLT